MWLRPPKPIVTETPITHEILLQALLVRKCYGCGAQVNKNECDYCGSKVLLTEKEAKEKGLP